MNTLERELKKEAAKTRTANGDVAYSTTYNANLDFFGSCGAMRGKEAQVVGMFTKAYYEDTVLALENLLRLRDVRGGLGERETFRACLKWLSVTNPLLTIKLLPAVVEYGRWDDILCLLDNKKTVHGVAGFIHKQLEEDWKNYKHGKPVSLCAKWLPSINASSKETVRLARILVREFKTTERNYRIVLSTLRKKIDILETHMSEVDYTFDYSKLPSKALMKHVKAFNRHDLDRYQEYLASLQSGEVKAKTKVVYPYEIIQMEDGVLREAMWRDLERNEGDTKTIVVRDGSGSMYSRLSAKSRTTAADVATSLAILFSEQLTGAFKNKFITFSMSPKFVDLSGYNSLKKKLEITEKENEVANTDIFKVYQLILSAELKCDPKDWIERIVVISDMQFDNCNGGRKIVRDRYGRSYYEYSGKWDESTHDTAKKMFQDAGIPFPQVVYWNVNSKEDFPTSDIQDTRFVSGFSQYIVKGILEDRSISAIDFMVQELQKYSCVIGAIAG